MEVLRKRAQYIFKLAARIKSVTVLRYPIFNKFIMFTYVTYGTGRSSFVYLVRLYSTTAEGL